MIGNLIVGTITSAFGVFYFHVGRKQHDITRLLCGFGLLIAPWFFTGVFWLIVVSVIIGLIPPALDRFGLVE